MRKAIFIIGLVVISLCLFGCLNEQSHEHSYGKWTTVQKATCTETGVEERKCSCGDVQTQRINATNHKWTEATCTMPKTCTVCFATQGSASGHSWVAATCITPKKCSACGLTDGVALGHKRDGFNCSLCGKQMIEKGDVPSILDIPSITYDVNSVGGINLYWTFVNKSETKTIKYITMTMQFRNRVGDIVADKATHKYATSIQYTGPLGPGKFSDKLVCKACFYCSDFDGSMIVKKIKIEYTDGTTIEFDEELACETVVRWRKS